MLNDWIIKHAGTAADCRRSATGTTIALAWTPATGTVAIMGRTIAGDRTLASGTITVTSATRVIRMTATIGVGIPIKEIIAPISAEDAIGDDWLSRSHCQGANRVAGGGQTASTATLGATKEGGRNGGLA